MKSPVGTTEKVIETWSLNPGSESGILNREAFREVRATSSRPYGTFHFSNLYPGLRPGLRSAVPAGLSFAIESLGPYRTIVLYPDMSAA